MTTVSEQFREACEMVDAAIFTGGYLEANDGAFLPEFREYMERWARALARIEAEGDDTLSL